MNLIGYQHLDKEAIDMMRTRIKTSCLGAVSMYFNVIPSFVLKLCILRAW